MRQVLFRLPLKPFDWLPAWWPDSMPFYGFGMMLFITFLATTWLASRRARRAGINPQILQDLAIWIFVGGIVGARIVYMVQYHEDPRHFFMIWQGGLVFYGSAIGGAVGYALAYWFVIRKQGLSSWKLADIVAPTVALGLLIGRVGCFLNGCCFGNVACSDCPAVHFPLSAPARYQLVERGLQTPAGFTMAENVDGHAVAAVEPESAAARSGLRVGDVLTRIESRGDREPVKTVELTSGRSVYSLDLREQINWQWLHREPPAAQVDLRLTVRRDGQPVTLEWFPLPRTGEAAAIDFGFTMADCTVAEVDPASRVYQQGGLRPGDVIVRLNDRPVNCYPDLDQYLGSAGAWPRGENRLALAVVHRGGSAPADLATVKPRTLGLHPTQLYESISMALLFLVLAAYEPLRRREGMLMVAFILGYAVHRFLNEMLRNDTDIIHVGHFNTGMTLSQNGSILFLAVGLGLLVWLWGKPPPDALQSAAVAKARVRV